MKNSDCFALFDAAREEGEEDDEGGEDGRLPPERCLEGLFVREAVVFEAGNGEGEGEGGCSVAEVEGEAFDGKDGSSFRGIGEAVEFF